MRKQKWFVLPSSAAGCQYYRQRLWIKHMTPFLKSIGVRVHFAISRKMSQALDADVCFFSRSIGADNLSAIYELKRMGKKIIWDCDDDITIPERWVEKDQNLVSKEIAAFLVCLDLADRIVVSTEPLARALGFPQKTTVLQNLIDLDDWPMQHSPSETERPRILYAGSNTHGRDLNLIADLYATTKNDCEWIFFGIQPKFATRAALCIPLTRIDDYPKVCRILKPDICLAPLEPCAFNTCKSPIKVWEMATTGAGVVASNFGPYSGHPAAIVGPGQPFRKCHLAYGISNRGKPRMAALENSWQLSDARGRWEEVFREIAEAE